MANLDHLEIIIKRGVFEWNQWRKEKNIIRPDLREANLDKIDLSDIDLKNAILSCASLKNTRLVQADLSGADLSNADLSNSDCTKANLSHTYLGNAILYQTVLLEANLSHADLIKANLQYARLNNANLTFADLTGADFSFADLSNVCLERTALVGTNFSNADLKNSWIYGISVWDVKLIGAIQIGLIITSKTQNIIKGSPIITVDNLEVAQFIYLLLNNENIRSVIDTITSKVVLILGRFIEERKVVLDQIKEFLRIHDYLPVLFDFRGPASRDLSETISTLAHLSRFVIVDITDPKSIPQELETIIPRLPSVPIQPIIHSSEKEYAMFGHYKSFRSVLPVYRYSDIKTLILDFEEKVIEPAEEKLIELRKTNPSD